MRKKTSKAAKVASKVVGATVFTAGVFFVSVLILVAALPDSINPVGNA